MPLCREFDEKMMKLVWRSRHSHAASVITTATSSSVPSITGSHVNLNEKASLTRASVTVAEATVVTAALAEKEKEKEATPAPAPVTAPAKKSIFSWKLSKQKPSEIDPEKGPSGPQPRPIRYFAPFYNGLGAALAVCTLFAHRSSSSVNPNFFAHRI